MVVLLIQCPPGIQAGQILVVQHEGKAFQVSVPDGVTPGNDFEVSMPDLQQARQYVAAQGSPVPKVSSATASITSPNVPSAQPSTDMELTRVTGHVISIQRPNQMGTALQAANLTAASQMQMAAPQMQMMGVPQMQMTGRQATQQQEGCCCIGHSAKGCCCIGENAEGICCVGSKGKGMCCIGEGAEGMCCINKGGKGMCCVAQDSEGCFFVPPGLQGCCCCCVKPLTRVPNEVLLGNQR
mmetsp:Transcript_81305/g.143439  ORF Transcript_81305/g.143439 Transcript_81305/m.143439 type:complete len:240 (-) Transcript_81305:246-965(-)